MITVVIIASDQRAEMLKDHFQPLVTALISVYSDYEHGLKSVFEKRPDLVFIQGEIGPVSGGTIAKQIKALLRDAAPRIILLGDMITLKEKARSWYDDSLDYSLADNDLISQFQERLRKHLPDIWREEAGDAADISGLEVGSKWDTVVSASGAATPMSDHSASGEYRPAAHTGQHSGERPLPAESGTAEPLPVGKAVTPASSGAPSRVINQKPSKPSLSRQPAVAQPATQTFFEPPAPGRNQPRFSPSFPERRPVGHNPWLYVGGLAAAVVLAAVIYYFTYPPHPVPSPPPASAPPKAQPQKPAAARPATRARIARLPEIVPVSGRDSGYESRHPGWSRYIGNDMEFKVFSDKGEIKAIQVLSSGAAPLADEMPKRLLAQIFADESYSSAEPMEKKGYLVQQSALAGGAEMLVYRKKGMTGIRGIVISVP